MPIVIAAVIVVASWELFSSAACLEERSATGGNAAAAQLSGINADRIFVSCYTICGTLCSIAALLMIGRMGCGQPNCGATWISNASSTRFTWRCKLPWRRRKLTKAISGIILIVMLTNGLTLCGVNEYIQKVITGGVFLFAVVLDSYQHNHLKFFIKKVKA